MRTLIGILALFVSSQVLAQLTPSPEAKQAYEMCQAAIVEGYGSRSKEHFCQESYDLPDPFLIKCIRWWRTGFPENSNLKSCQFYCESNKNWGPWYDYEIEIDDKVIFVEMKNRNQQNRCLED